MRIKYITFCFFFPFVCSLCFAQDTPEKPQTKTLTQAIPLLTVTGRVISRGKDIVLITSEGKGYLLKKNEGLEEMFDKTKEFVDKDADVTISCIETAETKGFRVIDHRAQKATETNYQILRVALFQKAEQGSKVTNLDISKSVDYQAPHPEAITQPLRIIRGTISKCNFKSVIPTIELEGKEGIAFTLSSDTKVLKVIGSDIMNFEPEGVLKEGSEVEVLYQEKGYQYIAKVISILK